MTVNDPALPAANVVWSALEIVGGWLTVSVKLWVGVGPVLLVAVIVIG